MHVGERSGGHCSQVPVTPEQSKQVLYEHDVRQNAWAHPTEALQS